MGRKSKLSEKQWAEVDRLLLEGVVSRSEIAKKFKVGKSTIQARYSERTEKIKNAALQLVASEAAISELNVADKITAFNYAAELRAISSNLLESAKNGARSSVLLSKMATEHLESIGSDENPNLTDDNLAKVHALQKTANEAAKIGVELISANKEATAPPPPPPMTRDEFYGR